MRDANIMRLHQGTSQIQRLRIARETLLSRQPRRAVAPEPIAA
jgi:alkylation response protein AidB-like acyl-CoA dehydrogenase